MDIQDAPHFVHFRLVVPGSIRRDTGFRLICRRNVVRAAGGIHCARPLFLGFVPFLGLLPILLSSNPFAINTVTTIKAPVNITKYHKPSVWQLSFTHPDTPRTCHHFVPPTIFFVISSPPKALMRYLAASSQQDIGTHSLTTWTHGGEGVRMLENSCISSTVCLMAFLEEVVEMKCGVLTW